MDTANVMLTNIAYINALLFHLTYPIATSCPSLYALCNLEKPI